MEDPNPNKRQCKNPNSFPNVPVLSENDVDRITSSFLPLPNLPLAIEYAFDRVLDKLSEPSGDDDRLIDRTCNLASLLHESVERCSRKRATLHNSDSWFLPHEVTIKVFSKLDTKSLMQAMTCCTMFNECAMDPFCYSQIDLTTAFAFVCDRVVYTMIQRARNELRSIKLGCVSEDDYVSFWLTRSCLDPLYFCDGFSGCLDNESLRDALSVCSNLTDLKIIGIDKNIHPLGEVLELLPDQCKLLFIENEIESGTAHSLYVTSLGSHNITSLSLIGLLLEDSTVYFLVKTLRRLKYMNLSRSFGISGSFLSDDCGDTLLETLILRDCFTLEERQVLMFLDSLLKGYFRFIRHIDVSNNHGLASDGMRSFKPKFPLEELKEERPCFTFVADFPSGSCYSSVEEEEKDLDWRKIQAYEFIRFCESGKREISRTISLQIDSILLNGLDCEGDVVIEAEKLSRRLIRRYQDGRVNINFKSEYTVILWKHFLDYQ